MHVTGYPGRAEAACRVLVTSLDAGLSDEQRELLLTQWRRPRPLLKAGQQLSASELRIACEDTSDGVGTALRQIARASGVSIRVHERLFTIEALLEVAAMSCRVSAIDLFFGASVDFGLAFTAPSETQVEAKLLVEIDLPLYRLGEVVEGQGDVVFERSDGRLQQSLPGTEYLQ